MQNYIDSPLVSVVVTTYNRPEMLERACKSIFNQSYDNIEIIIVDDNSTNDYSNLVEVLKNKSPYPLYFYKNSSNKGACFSRNFGISVSNGHFISGLDDDDEFTPDRISDFVSKYNPKYSFLSSNSVVITKSGSRLYSKLKEDKVILLEDMLWSNICGTQIFIEKEKMIAIGGFDTSLTSAQDADMWLRLIEEYGPALRLSKPTFILHTEHEAGRISDNKTKGMEMMLDKHRAKMSVSQARFRQFKIDYYKNSHLAFLMLIIKLDIKSLIYIYKSKTSRL